jgi:integrase
LENKGKPFSSPTITLRLNRIFKKAISTSMLRHIWTTDKYKDMPALKAMQENAEAMGHSLEQHLEYIKKA